MSCHYSNLDSSGNKMKKSPHSTEMEHGKPTNAAEELITNNINDY